MIETILIPTDGSEHAKRAVDLGGDLAAKYGAKVVVMHVLLRGRVPEGLLRAAEAEHVAHVPERKAQGLAIYPQEIFARNVKGEGSRLPVEVLQFIGKQITSTAEQRLRAKGVGSLQTLVREGDAAEEILAAAQETKADMIVMGQRGLSNIRGLLMGSVSDKLTHLAHCTCVTVK